MSTPVFANTNIYTQNAVEPILDDIKKSVDQILNARAIELNEFLRQQRNEVDKVIIRKAQMSLELEKLKEDKETDEIIKKIENEFEKEQIKLIHATNMLRKSIIQAIRAQNCEEGKQKMTTVPGLLSKLTGEVQEMTTKVQIFEQQEQEQHLFRNMISGFKETFYKGLDRLQEYTKNQLARINELLETSVDTEYGVSAMYDDNLSVASSYKTVLTNATDETGRLLDKAFQPGIGCITMAGIKQLRARLGDVRDRLYSFIFSDILSQSGKSEMTKRRRFLDAAIPGKVNFGMDSQNSNSSIDTDIVDSLDEVPTFYPPDLRRTYSLPVAPVEFYPPDLRRTYSLPVTPIESDTENLSAKTEDLRLLSKVQWKPGKSSILSGRFGRLYNPLGNPRGNKTKRPKSRGGKMRRRTTHKRKNK